MKSIDHKTLLAEIMTRRADGKRQLIAIAGAPAAGKSTLADELCQQINAQAGDQQPAVVVPMDGFHYDNTILDARGHRARKGAPHTFDVEGFANLLERLRSSDRDVAIPVFDRVLDLTRGSAAIVTRQHRILLIEGNYLLLNRPIWCELRQYFDLSVFLQVPLEILERRLIQRWLDHGADMAAARKRAMDNDIPNAELVLQYSQSADFILQD